LREFNPCSYRLAGTIPSNIRQRRDPSTKAPRDDPAPRPRSPRERLEIPVFDALRWIAATLVVIAHVRDLLMAPAGEVTTLGGRILCIFLIFFTGFGHEAVAVFFVLSGFLVGGPLLARPLATRASVRKYLVDRTSRIYVVLLPALAVTAAVSILGPRWMPNAPIFFGGDWALSLDFAFQENLDAYTLACNFFSLQTIACDTYGLNRPLWSLACEWFYYMSYPALLWALIAGPRRGTPLRVLTLRFAD
jgi:peptidoglycan/LPS O-acetylase OafA/YrhL